MGPTTILRAELAEQFRFALECGRAVLFTAPCGFGKTTAARALLVDDLQNLPEEAEQALGALIREAVYRRFDLSIRRLLLELAPFESIDVELARLVSGDNRAGELLGRLQQKTSMLLQDRLGRFRFYRLFRLFLCWELDREYTTDQQKSLYSRGGLYYELREDYGHALACYSRAKDHSKVSELLEKSAQLHPGLGHYEEVEPYYHSLPEAEIRNSPALMQGMSMLCALEMDYEGSERWYRALREFADRRKSGDAARREARGRLAWLDIALLQRGTVGLTDRIPAVFCLLTCREIKLPPFSVTSTLPSVMNGGKDFSDWSKADDLLYQTLRRPVEAVLGRDGVGLADLAMAESKFEKGGGRLRPDALPRGKAEHHPPEGHAGHGIYPGGAAGPGRDGRRPGPGRPGDLGGPAGAICPAEPEAVPPQPGRHALPGGSAPGEHDRRGPVVPGEGPPGPGAGPCAAALPVPHPGHGRAGAEGSEGRAADPGSSGVLLCGLREASGLPGPLLFTIRERMEILPISITLPIK